MIMYTACNNTYFDLYFDMWITCANKFYPDMPKYVAIGDATDEQLDRCLDAGAAPIPFAIRKQREDETWFNYRQIFFLLRWQHMPWQLNEHILETQINCLAVQTQHFDLAGIEHLRLCRIKRGKPGGLSAAVFTPDAAKKVTEKALSWNDNPPLGDHPINLWTAQNIPFIEMLAEQQFKTLEETLEPWTCWITAGTSANFTHDEKIYILKHYAKMAGVEL